MLLNELIKAVGTIYSILTKAAQVMDGHDIHGGKQLVTNMKKIFRLSSWTNHTVRSYRGYISTNSRSTTCFLLQT